jgi:AraC-like DNA-binding protein
VDDQYSDTEAVRLDWLQLFLWASILAMVILVGFFLANQLLSEGLSYAQAWYKFFAWGILLYVISIGGYYTRLPEKQAPAFEPDAVAPDAEAGKPIEDSALQSQLQAFMNEKRPFLESELTLNELAGQVRMSPAALSRLLNQQFGQNFNDFVNAYRVAEVKRQLADPANAHLSLLGIAFSCGFNSKATFNRAFKKITGASPSDFLASQKNG